MTAAPRPRRIAYVLDHPELGGGVKVVFQHADLLRRQGHDVTVLALGPRPPWYAEPVRYVDYAPGLPDLPPQDLVIATWWATLAVADAWGRGPVVHFCQGYEGDLVHLAPAFGAIEQAYRRPSPAFVVSPHLAAMLHARFGREARVVPPPVDRRFRPRWRFRPGRPPWVFVPGIFEAEVKGVATALEAVRELRRQGLPVCVLRVSVLPLSAAERAIVEPDRYLHAVHPAVVAEELPRADLLLFPSRPGEGFGLPLLEAMASGVPAVASRLPSTETIAGGAVPLVPPDDPGAFAKAAAALLGKASRWRAARRAGRRAARRFHEDVVGRALADAVEWAVTR